MGSPCRRPLDGNKAPEIQPLYLKENDTLTIQCIICCIHLWRNPILHMTFSKKLHSTLSNALLMSNLRAAVPSFPSPLFFIAWKTKSYKRLSVLIESLGYKSTLVPEIIWPNIGINFLAKVLEISLYNMLHKLIGLNSVIRLGSLIFRIKTMQLYVIYLIKIYLSTSPTLHKLNHIISYSIPKFLKKRERAFHKVSELY